MEQQTRTIWSRSVSNLRTPRVIAVLLVFVLSGAALALLLTVGLGGWPVTTPGGAVTGSTPTFTTAGDRLTLDEVLRRARTGEIDAISAMTPGEGVGVGAATPVLIARTTNGDIHAIRPEVPVGDALDVIRAAGYAPLLTDEAIALDPGAASGGLPSFVGLAMAVSLLILAALLFARLRGAGAGGRSWRPSRVGQRRRRTDQAIAGERPSITLADVAGCDEAKLELTETIEFLRRPSGSTSSAPGSRAAIMLYGPPGTGKTMLARAVAAEAGVPFHYASGSEFVEKYVGVGARRDPRPVRPGPQARPRRHLLRRVRRPRQGPRRRRTATRSASRRSTSCSSSSTASATTEDIVVIAATNRLDVLDSGGPSARPLQPQDPRRRCPTSTGRRAILEVHARDKPLADDVDLDDARPQDVRLLRRAAGRPAQRGRDPGRPPRRATRSRPRTSTPAGSRSRVGTSRRRSMDERERSIIAAHEVGHAICGKRPRRQAPGRGDQPVRPRRGARRHGQQPGGQRPPVRVRPARPARRADGRPRGRGAAVPRGHRRRLERLREGEPDRDDAWSRNWGMGRDPEATDEGATGRGILTFLVGDTSAGFSRDVRDAQARAIRSILDEAYAGARRTLDRQDASRSATWRPTCTSRSGSTATSSRLSWTVDCARRTRWDGAPPRHPRALGRDPDQRSRNGAGDASARCRAPSPLGPVAATIAQSSCRGRSQSWWRSR